MPFIGKSPSDGNHNVLMDAVTTADNTAGYALTRDSVAYTPISAQSLMVSLNGVTQAPIAAYTVSGNTITFASNLMAADVIDYIIAFEGPRQSISVDDIDDGTITTAMLAANAVDTGQIADDAIGSDQLDGSLTVDINGGAIDGAVIGANSAAAGTFSTVTDAKGLVRTIPVNDQNSTYSLVAGDVGKVIDAAGAITVPASVFSAGDAISIYNNTTGDLTITCSAITTAYKAGTNADVNSVTLETRGIATILFIEATVCVLGGNLA